MFKKTLIAICVILLLTDSLNAKTLEVCVYTSDKEITMKKKISPLVSYLQKELGNNINLTLNIYPSYKKAIDALTRGKCSIARFGPVSYVTAKKYNPKIRIIAIELKNGKKINSGHFVVHEKSKIKKLKDIIGKDVAFGNKFSTIGRYLAQNELLKRGIKASDLKSCVYLGRHDAVAMGVYIRRYDIGPIKDGTLKKYKIKNLKEIAKINAITKPWIASSKVDKSLFIKLQNIFLNLQDKEILKNLGNNGFTLGKDSEFNIIRRAMKNAQLFDKTNKCKIVTKKAIYSKK